MENWQFAFIIVSIWVSGYALDKKIDSNWELLQEIKQFLGVDESEPRYD